MKKKMYAICIFVLFLYSFCMAAMMFYMDYFTKTNMNNPWLYFANDVFGICLLAFSAMLLVRNFLKKYQMSTYIIVIGVAVCVVRVVFVVDFISPTLPFDVYYTMLFPQLFLIIFSLVELAKNRRNLMKTD